MFCYQCEQTAGGTGCTKSGVCGKDHRTATLQDLLIHAAKGISMYAHGARGLGECSRRVDVFVLEALFSTITNVDFDPERLRRLLAEAIDVREEARRLYEGAAGKETQRLGLAAAWVPAGDEAGLLKQGEELSGHLRRERLGEDVAGLQDLLLFGLKGMAAYADHAQILGQADESLFAFIHEALDFLAHEPRDPEALTAMCLKCGEANLRAMELLDAANTGAYGQPLPTAVRVEPIRGKAIAVSGHDLKDLEGVLKQSEGKGINVYTHGEMLPAHGYPGLKKYKHLAGNYGGAWQNQQSEFDEFPGAILMTTNCIQRPRGPYKSRIFTSGLVAYPGVAHIKDGDFRPLVDAALAAEGFKESGPDKTIMVGYARGAILAAAGKIVEAVKAGKIRHFFLIGGCDGAKPGRSYYSELAQAVPADCVILTLACGKYRFNKLDFGLIEGIPRLLDIGQCNDAYSAIQVALALAKAFGVGVNDLPLSLVVSWYEQKAVAVLLTLLALGIRNIRLGPSLPAFVTPNVLGVLAEKFNVMPISTPREDLEAMLGR